MENQKIFAFFFKTNLPVAGLLIFVSGCGDSTLKAIEPTVSDELVVSEGLAVEQLIAWGDPISETQNFGYDNSFLTFFDADGEDLLVVGHQDAIPSIVSDYDEKLRFRTAIQVKMEQYQVGASVLQVGGWWSWSVKNASLLNKRLVANNPIPYDRLKVSEEDMAPGVAMIASGGATPWGTVLLGEGDYQRFYGDMNYEADRFIPSELQWESFTGVGPQHFGWIVELDPVSGVAKKWPSMGRFNHAGLAIAEREERVVIYSGDDDPEGCLYKFIAEKQGLEAGQLYVADFENGKWKAIEFENLSFMFEDEISMLIRTREAAMQSGGTSMGRVGGIAVHPQSGEILFAIKNGQILGDNFGSIVQLTEQTGDPLSFQWVSYLEGGEETGLVHPAVLAFDPSGNLWIASDIPVKSIGTRVYQPYGNNGLFVQPASGSGKVLQVASAPIDARFGGICFSPDSESLFLSVQHPGASSIFGLFSSHWPEGGSAKPKSAVVVLEGNFLDALSAD